MSGPYRGQRGSSGQGQGGWHQGRGGGRAGSWRGGVYHGQAPPHQGPPQGQYYGQGPPHHGPPPGQFYGQGPPHHGPPHGQYYGQGPPHHGPPHGQFYGQGPPHHGPPHGQYYGQGPPHHGMPTGYYGQGPSHQGPPSHYQPPGHGGFGQHGFGFGGPGQADPWQEAMRQQMEAMRRQEQMTRGHQFGRQQPSSTTGPSSGRAIGSRRGELEGLPIQGTAQRTAAASATGEPWTTGPWRTPSAEELAHRPPIEARRRNVSLPLQRHEMMSPAPPTDDPELEEEHRGVREMYNRIRNLWIRERHEWPQSRTEGLLNPEQFSRPHPFTPGLSIGSHDLARLLATKQRMGSSKLLLERKGKKPTKEEEDKANQKWEEKKKELLKQQLLESARQQSQAAEQRPMRRRTMSEQDVPQLTRSLSQLRLGQGQEPSRPRSMSTSDLPDYTRLFRSCRRLHPTKFPFDPRAMTDDDLREMGLRSHIELGRLLPSAIDRQFERLIRERMVHHTPYMRREQNIRAAGRGIAQAQRRSLKSVKTCDRLARQQQFRESAGLPQTVGSLDPQRQPHRVTIHEARPGEEEAEERRTREERRRSRERRRMEREARRAKGEEVSDDSSSSDEDQGPYFPQNWPPPGWGTGRRSSDRSRR